MKVSADGLIAWIRAEPVYTMGLVQAAAGLAIAFGLHLTAGQDVAIMIAAAAVLSAICRRYVSPVSPTPPPPT